jgi:hypothetical protein
MFPLSQGSLWGSTLPSILSGSFLIAGLLAIERTSSLCSGRQGRLICRGQSYSQPLSKSPVYLTTYLAMCGVLCKSSDRAITVVITDDMLTCKTRQIVR